MAYLCGFIELFKKEQDSRLYQIESLSLAKDAQNDTMQHLSKIATFHDFCNIRANLQHLNFLQHSDDFVTFTIFCNDQTLA